LSAPTELYDDRAAATAGVTREVGGVRAGIIVLIGIAAGNLGNYGFHLASARSLGPASYADVATLAALAGFITLPLVGVQLALARYVAEFAATGDRPAIAYVYRRSLGLAMKIGLGATAVALSLAVPIQRLLDIDSLPAVVLTMLITAPALMTPIVWGLAQGLQRFSLFSFSLGAGPAMRVVAVVVLLAAGYGVAGAMGATLAATIVSLAVPLWYLRSWLREQMAAATPVQARRAAAYVIPVVIGVLSITLLSTTDVVVAKLALPDDEAGLYGGASLIGRVILYFPAAIVMVLLPRVSARAATGRETAHVLRQSLVATGAFCAAATAIYAALPELVLSIAFGSKFEDAASFLWMFAVAMTGFAFVNVLLAYHLALGHSRFSWILLAGAVVQVGLFALFHDSPEQLLAVDIAVAATLLALHIVFTKVSVIEPADAPGAA
jgi:O-antigen/teichoic acid export membrane protein